MTLTQSFTYGHPPVGCINPCYSIDDFHNTLFPVTGCGSCTAGPTVNTKTLNAWDGVFRPDIPEVIPVVGELRFPYWDHCSYTLGRNGGEISGFTTHGKALAVSTPGAGGDMSITTFQTFVRLECATSGDNIVLWEGESNSSIPEASPIRRTGGCATGPAEITLTKLSPQGCICNEYVASACPTAAECEACGSLPTSTYAGWIFEVSGFSGSCATLNGVMAVVDSHHSECKWSTSATKDLTRDPAFSVSPEAHILCVDLGNGDGRWFYRDGITYPAGAELGPVLSDDDDEPFYPSDSACAGHSNCPPKPSNWTSVNIVGICNCAGQSGNVSFRYTTDFRPDSGSGKVVCDD